MISRNNVQTSGIDNVVGGNVDLSQYYTPLFKLKLDTIAVNDISIESIFKVRWFSKNENYENEYFAKFTISNKQPGLIFYKNNDSEGVGVKVCIIKNESNEYCLYAKGGNSSMKVGAQVLYCTHPEEISIPIDIDVIPVANIDSFNPVYPSDKISLTYESTTPYVVAVNDFQQYATIKRDGKCEVNLTFYKSGSIPSINDVITTFNHKPIIHNIPVMLLYRQLNDSTKCEIGWGHISSSTGELIVDSVPTTITGSTYININTQWDSIKNSI